MHFFGSQALFLGKRLLLLLLLFFFGRLYFFFHNFQYFLPAWPEEVLDSFIYGIQFDVAAIVYFNLPFIIFHLLPGNFTRSRTTEGIMKYYFIIVNGLLLLSNLTDAEYFRFTSKRTTSDIFGLAGIGNDLVSLMPAFIRDFWYIFLIWFVVMFLTWKIYPSRPPRNDNYETFTFKRIATHSLMMLVLTAFLISLARGYRLKPLGIITATNYVSATNIPLILNTPFTILKSYNKQHLRIPEYFPEGGAEDFYSPVCNFPKKEKSEKLNVVVIIMESFSAEFSGHLSGSKGYTPFLDSLMQNSLYFPNAFANSKKSVEALPAILASLPVLMETPFVSSPYSGNAINSLPGYLGEHYYHTSFFHGGKNGTMGFDNFTRLAGIENYFGMDEYGNDDHYDQNWGIFDEEFFDFFAGKLNTFPEPFFSGFFSLSSHHPYTIPEKHEGRFPEGDNPIHQSVAYADYSLGKFFDNVKDMPWFGNTLFVITADHTAQSQHPYYKNRIGNYAVPLLFYHPGNRELTGRDERLTQHIDIMPSVLDYLGVDGEFIAFGNSVFGENDRKFVINYLNRVYQYQEGDWVMFHDGNQPTGLFNCKTDSLLNNNYALLPVAGLPMEVEVADIENRMKSIIYEFNSRMINNKLRTY